MILWYSGFYFHIWFLPFVSARSWLVSGSGVSESARTLLWGSDKLPNHLLYIFTITHTYTYTHTHTHTYTHTHTCTYTYTYTYIHTHIYIYVDKIPNMHAPSYQSHHFISLHGKNTYPSPTYWNPLWAGMGLCENSVLQKLTVHHYPWRKRAKQIITMFFRHDTDIPDSTMDIP